jgi:hypothetical protein
MAADQSPAVRILRAQTCGQARCRCHLVVRQGHGCTHCPTHDDEHPSLSVDPGQKQPVVVNCTAGCPPERVIAALQAKDLWPGPGSARRTGRGREHTPPRNGATLQHLAQSGAGAQIVASNSIASGATTPRNGATPRAAPTHAQGSVSRCTLETYAAAKELPLDFLQGLGLSTVYLAGGDSEVRIPYRSPMGLDVAIRLRRRLKKGAHGDDRFRWKTGAKPCLYGLDRLADARREGYVVIVEGESDCHTLWYHGIPALGVPGATTWRESRDAPHLEGIQKIYVVREPDHGGDGMERWLGRSHIRERACLIHLGEYKDPSALHLAMDGDRDRFKNAWQAAVAAAEPWTAREEVARQAQVAAAWAACADLAGAPSILERFTTDLAATGVVGETRAAQLLYLAVTSRLLPRPVSAVVKGPSSAGKSHLTQAVLAFFPSEAYYALSGMSERALAYSEEPIVHRMLVIYEAAGLQGDFASYLLRSLLSEGRVRYETVIKTEDGLASHLIDREGPTGVLLTTTAPQLHPENETRLLSIPVNDTAEQTRAVLRALANEDTTSAAVDRAQWQALQIWLGGQPNAVTIPYSLLLAELMPAVAVRLRRDFGAVLALISAHALLHQANRQCDVQGRVVATLDDYAAVRALVADLLAEGVGADVAETTRETVEAVERLAAAHPDGVSLTALAVELKLDKSAAQRRVKTAVARGYLVNREDRRGRPARLAVGDALPNPSQVLPPCDKLEALAGIEPMQGIAPGSAMAQVAKDDAGTPNAEQRCSVAATIVSAYPLPSTPDESDEGVAAGDEVRTWRG